MSLCKRHAAILFLSGVAALAEAQDQDPLIPPRHETVVIVATAVDPGIDRRNGALYRETLFSRDDQLFHTLDAGINAGQHEGGGKSVEIRRFGFNLDHGGVGGGLKVLVDGVQQNQTTQGHGQGYLGSLKSVTPELIEDVDVLDGPFSAEYGDFSGLGVVHVRLKESLADPVTLRVQAGSFDSLRTFVAVSPRSAKADSFLAYEGSRTDGPFLAPLHHRRDSLTGSYARRRSDTESFGLRLNVGRNDFSSSGQVPLDEVEAGRLDRFGFLDPDNGGRVRAGTLGGHYRRQLRSGDLLKLDAFVSRSLFDLYSDFTFFLNDERSGDEVQQHDSRLQGGANAQWLRPHRLFGHPAVLVSGANVHDNHIRVGLSPTVARRPVGVATLAHAHVANAAGYLQEGADLLDGRLHVEAGLRFDAFRFAIEDQVDAEGSGVSTAAALQPKATLAFTPSPRLPLTLHLRYGRGISSQDARGVVRSPSGPKLSTTDFYQVGLSSSGRRVSAAAALFLIDRSHEQVYIPDDGSIEFAGPSRSSGFEVKATAHLTGALSVNGGLTQVISAFYRGTVPRAYVEAAPHTVASAGLTLTGWKGLSGSLRYRHVSDYRLDALDPSVIAGGLDVVDLSLRRSLGRRASLSLSLDNLTDARYYETQNYFESRLRPEEPALARIHGTPGYPRTLTAGIMVQLPLH